MNALTENEAVNPDIPDELATLKARADLMDINYHPNIGLDKLRAKVKIKMAGETAIAEPIEGVSVAPILTDVTYMTHAEFLVEQKNVARKSVNRLVRCNVSCMNPDKSEWPGEIISVGSSKLGTFKKFVQFNSDAGYHIPHIIYEAIKERKYTTYTTVIGKLGQKVRKGKLANEFNIQVLPPLTEVEREELKQQQALAGSITA